MMMKPKISSQPNAFEIAHLGYEFDDQEPSLEVYLDLSRFQHQKSDRKARQAKVLALPNFIRVFNQ